MTAQSPEGSGAGDPIAISVQRGGRMPRYEIIAHVTRELTCESAEDAAAIFRHQLLAETGPEDALLHLAVWREDPAPVTSPLPSSLRQMLVDFFATLERYAGEAEVTFRERVAAILTVSAPGAAGAEGRSQAVAPQRSRLASDHPVSRSSPIT
jgi:hypothetical protein